MQYIYPDHLVRIPDLHSTCRLTERRHQSGAEHDASNRGRRELRYSRVQAFPDGLGSCDMGVSELERAEIRSEAARDGEDGYHRIYENRKCQVYQEKRVHVQPRSG